jgi:WD40 repeat protein
MTMLRHVCCKTIVIVLLVAAGLWYAERADLANQYLPLGATGNGSQDGRASLVRVVWFPGGDRLLTLARCAVHQYSPLVQYNLADGSQGPPVDVEGELVSTISISPDGRHTLVGTFSGHLWWIGFDSDERTTLIVLPSGSAITSAAISHDGRWVAAADDCNGRVVLCPVPPGTEYSSDTNGQYLTASPRERSAAGGVILAENLRTVSRDIRFSESGDRLLSAGIDGSIRVWDLQTRTLMQTFRDEMIPITTAVFLPGEDRIMSASRDDTVRIWDVVSGRETWRAQFEGCGLNSLALSPDGKTAAWGGRDRNIYIWNIEQRRKTIIETPATIIWDLGFSPDGKSLAAVGNKGPIRIYGATTGALQRQIDVWE